LACSGLVPWHVDLLQLLQISVIQNIELSMNITNVA
jgi:hypothetical protein